MNKVIGSKYNTVTIIDNIVLYNWNLPREYNLTFSPKKKKEGENRWISEVTDVLINGDKVGNFSQCISNHVKHFKYITKLLVNCTSVRLRKKSQSSQDTDVPSESIPSPQKSLYNLEISPPYSIQEFIQFYIQ